jgi:dynein heavy chain
VADFKENLLALYHKAGVKGTQVAFLLTDSQIANDKFLVYINDFLATGYIADLCTPVRFTCKCLRKDNSKAKQGKAKFM